MQILVPGWYVEDPAGYVSEKGGYLGRGDLPSLVCGGVTIHCGGVAARRAQSPHVVDDVQTGLCGTHPGAAGPSSISEGLTVVIVFLLAKA